MPQQHAVRRDRLRALLAEADLDAALITHRVNVRYLTGFTGSNAALLVTASTAVLATDSRYAVAAAEQASDVEVLLARGVAASLAERVEREQVARAGYETHVLSIDDARAVEQASPTVTWTSLGRAVEALRTVKDDTELELLGRATAAGDAALTDLLGGLTVGQSERRIARRLERLLVEHGADAVGFPTIVAAGPHGAMPHHEPCDRPVGRGELVTIDFGGQVGGYHADCTRTVLVGAAPEQWQAELYELVRTAQQAGTAALAPGARAADVDAAARRMIEQAGYGEAFGHGLGHGVGLEVHEEPLLAASSPATLTDRVPLTVEPGVYLPGRGGVRIEDTLVVRPGGPELLTTTTKDLLVLG